ncbi:Sensor histidine kinase LiaS [Pontiella desulfatans]|uniref:Sensor histidine kinase LiaS n=1 Tax=Pontiella desulfatans TaxID=2750659 RepID=A0A6C2TWH4_PONDE|nr:Sensor histidine kinase LiaS [Pontiella desulfatans]
MPVLLAVLISGTAFARAPITSIAAVRDLAPEMAEKGQPVRVEGQVLWVHPTGNGFFLRGGEVSIYVRQPRGGPAYSRFSPGEMVRVEGVSNKGFFSPSIYADSVELVGSEPLPEARPFHDFEFFSATIDCDWVWVAGRIVSMRVYSGGTGGENITLAVQHNNSMLDVQIPQTEGAEEKVAELMFSRIRFNAVAGTQFNMNRQVVGRTFFVNSVDDFEVIDDYKPRKGLRVLPIHELMRSGENDRLPVGTHGLVSHVEGKHIYLRGEEACIKVTARAVPDVVVGDYVELEGFVRPLPISPEFLAREVRVVGHREPPLPVAMEVDEALRHKWDYFPATDLNQELVEIEALLVDVGESFGLSTGERERTLLCRHNTYLFEAKLPAHVEIEGGLKPGATLRLTGICNLTRSEERRWRLYIDWFWIQLRGAGDVEILVPAPWWTAARLLWVLGIGLGVLALALVWVGLLHRTVEKQTGIIGDKIEREAILDERQRIARELHDNLEQGLAGMAIQLRGSQRLLELNMKRRLESIACALRLAGGNTELKNHLEGAATEVEQDAAKNRRAIEVVQGMLAHCSEESRSSILDLRGGLLERMDLPAALRAALEPLAEECGARLVVSVEGEPRRLKKVAERNLLLIAKEAATNAARHAKPSTLSVELVFADDVLSLRIVDDGQGFAVDHLPKAGRFGLQGMHERINQLNGSIQIKSALDKGTAVGLNIPSTKEWELD